MIAVFGFFVLLFGLLVAKNSMIGHVVDLSNASNNVLATYENINENWNMTFVHWGFTKSVSGAVNPQILSHDYKASKVNYTCMVYSHCDLGLEDCQNLQPELTCFPNLPHYPPTFLGLSYENLTTLWCEKFTSDNTIVLSSQINPNDTIIKNSCFLVVHSNEIEQPDERIIYIIPATFLLLLTIIGFFIYKGQLDGNNICLM